MDHSKATVFIVVYSIDERTSFSATSDYLYALLEESRKAKFKNSRSMLVGNKVDLERKRKIRKSG